MTGWIEKNINPPGLRKKNRGSLFRAAGKIFGIVRDDALAAFNAHFPYLADKEKLEEHARALLIPHMADDTEEEYRNRVAAASFFLSRAGERDYILNQLEAHLNDRFTLNEEFLRVFVKVTDLSDTDRKWVLEFLDNILDPNIFMEVSEWFAFKEKVDMSDGFGTINIRKEMSDTFRCGGLKFNGRAKHDGHTLNDTEYAALKANGTIKFDGSKKHRAELVPATSYVRIPIKARNGITDMLKIGINTGNYTEEYRTRLKHNGMAKADGRNKFNGISRISDSFTIGMRYHHKHNGSYKADGGIKFNSSILIPL
jgi:hypothetical protein